MNKEWIVDWKKKIKEGKFLLRGITSTSKSLDVALNFSKCHSEYSFYQTPVLFVFSIWNYVGFNGFRLNDKRYSMYP